MFKNQAKDILFLKGKSELDLIPYNKGVHIYLQSDNIAYDQYEIATHSNAIGE